MFRRNHRFLRQCAAATAALIVAGTAQAVDLRSWDQKINAASNRFIVLASFNSEAVLDKETQLVWERTPNASLVTQFSATQSCMGRTTGGRRGWRLPSFHEMASLANPSAASGSLALPAGHPFKAVANGRYWTATELRDSSLASSYTYTVNLGAGGFLNYWPSGNSEYHWCVRGGGPISEY